METLRDLDIVRAVMVHGAVLRADGGGDGGGLGTLVSRFSPFDTWYEIDSMWEGNFLERTVHGAFAKTMAEQRDKVVCLFNHGYDMQIDQKLLGTIDALREDPDSAVGEVSLYDTSYNRDLLPGLRAGGYGSSFRFRVIRDEWNDEPGKSAANPEGIPERTIKEVRLFEFGPVTFPANPDATAGTRCMTDDYYERVRSRDPQRVDALLVRARAIRTPDAGAAHLGTPADGAASTTTDAPATATRGLSPDRRAAQMRELELLEIS